MPIIARRNQTDFVLHPEGGPFAAVLAKVRLHEGVTTRFGTKDRVQLLFQTEVRLADHTDKVHDDRPMTISMFTNNSLNKRSRLLEIVGTQVPPAELDRLLAERGEFDLESLVGSQWQLMVSHEEREGQVYANVSAFMRGAKGQHLTIWQDGAPWPERHQVRQEMPAEELKATPELVPAGALADEDLPF